MARGRYLRRMGTSSVSVELMVGKGIGWGHTDNEGHLLLRLVLGVGVGESHDERRYEPEALQNEAIEKLCRCQRAPLEPHCVNGFSVKCRYVGSRHRRPEILLFGADFSLASHHSNTTPGPWIDLRMIGSRAQCRGNLPRFQEPLQLKEAGRADIRGACHSKGPRGPGMCEGI